MPIEFQVLPPERAEFWMNVSNWPIDTKEFVFLGRAVQRVGEALYGSEWTGNEPFAEYLSLPPNSRQLHSILADFHNNIFDRKLRDSIVRKCQVLLSQAFMFVDDWNFDPTLVEPSNRELRDNIDKICELAKIHDGLMRPLVKRFLVVRDFIIKRAQTNELEIATRALKGGAISEPLPSHIWNTEVVGARFDYCQINVQDPYSDVSFGDRPEWIFISRNSLEKFVSDIPCCPPPPPEVTEEEPSTQLEYSPYVSLMLQAIKELDISPTNQPKKSVIVNFISERWPKNVPPSQNLQDAMATLLREPASQAGRGRKLNNSKSES